MDFSVTCRFCLSEGLEMSNVNSILDVDDKQEIISNIVHVCLNIQLQSDDGYPQNICKFCIRKLHMTYEFKNIIEQSKIILERFYDENNKSIDYDVMEPKNEYSAVKASDQIDELFCSNSIFELETDQPIDVKNITNDTSDVSDDHSLENSSSAEAVKYLFCNSCNMRFIKQISLQKHFENNHSHLNSSGETVTNLRNKQTAPHVCPRCHQAYTSQLEFDTHIDTCNKDETAKITTERENNRVMTQCQYCGKSYPRGYIGVHLKIHGERKYKCKVCKKAFKQPSSLYLHRLNVHGSLKNHSCHICDKAYKTGSTLHKHVRQVHNNERSRICATCGKAFFSESGLKKHILSHTHIRNFRCHLCDKAYQSRSGLNIHLQSHKA